ncbi:hypothetical protein CR513_31958, partial [Mucuna pruriens]
LKNKNKQIVIKIPKTSTSKVEVNKNKELEIAKIENSLHDWSIPIVKKSDVYKQHKIWSITQDETHIIKYSYPGTRLIQVAAKPNYRLGINSPILMILRDLRLKKFNDSIIAILESNMHDGLAFFNCYPSFAMNLKNDKTSNAIKLYVKLPEDIVDEIFGPMQIIFRIYCKVTKIDYNFKALRSSSKNETILVEPNLRKSLVQTPRILSHHEVINKILEEWVLEDIVQEQKIYNTRVRDIIQDGLNIRLRMNRSQSIRINKPHMILKGQPFRHSIGSVKELDLQGLDGNNLIIVEPVYSENSESPNYSPTRSQVLNTLIREEPFEIDKKFGLDKTLKQKYNSDRRDLYFNTCSKEQIEKFREKYYRFMHKNENNVPQKEIEYPFNKQKEISTIGKVDDNWKTLEDKIVKSEYTPQQGIKLQLSNNLEIEASSYKDIRQNLDKLIEKSDIRKVHTQLNYSNIVLEVVTKQLGRIEIQNS